MPSKAILVTNSGRTKAKFGTSKFLLDNYSSINAYILLPIPILSPTWTISAGIIGTQGKEIDQLEELPLPKQLHVSYYNQTRTRPTLVCNYRLKFDHSFHWYQRAGSLPELPSRPSSTAALTIFLFQSWRGASIFTYRYVPRSPAGCPFCIIFKQNIATTKGTCHS
ncbi:uncharacterized protein LAJ45_06898 [Morchella importuna]|uniref:uncharacterized protein n=1 Tax=Morchella importuna TaxID=1174673 RepID=UPI001E8D3ED2|nr:uncharacterized protein LAJ45_06898 [Morchella importuna]KAH8148924.1 hypothetical protein LAJ45_06898 [Morchella importuna]